MCGLCGFVSSPGLFDRNGPRSILEAMTALLEHRGPDSSGTRVRLESDLTVGLGHRRLSIIDLSELGNQPMVNEDDTVAIAFNGEVYNHAAISDRLRAKGHTFRSRSDTEAIIHLYEDQGAGCLEQLDGMFAFAIWDSRQRSLLLARDRIGVKPLFYARLPAGIAFSSEAKSLFLVPGLAPRLSPPAVDAYMTFGYVPGPDTVYDGIRALRPGQWLRWTPAGVEEGYFWKPDPSAPLLRGSREELADELDRRLNAAVESHLVSDVPVGAFLSGGVDSSLVAAIASRHMKVPLHTFTIGFAGGGDERGYARTVAQHIGSNHHERTAEPDLAGHLPRLVWHLDQPLFDNSILPTYLVSQLAREEGKVVLAGDGGDEPFVGYGWTRAAAAIPSVPLPVPFGGWRWLYRKGALGLAQRGLYDVTHGADERYLRRMTIARALRDWLYTADFARTVDLDPVDDLRTLMRSWPTRDRRERYPLADLTTYLHEDVLFKVDRMSMAHGLEVRVPLLDHHLLEWAFRLPWGLRTSGRHGKVLLRQVAQRYLPPSILEPRKQGFTVPVGRWLHGETGLLVERIFSSERFRSRGIVRPERARTLLAMHRSRRFELGHRIWALVVLEVWCRVRLDGQSHEQSLASMLTETGDL